MERKLKILLIEDDPVECQAITQAINLKDDIFLIGATNNIFKAIELVQEGLPDAIILDLELHKGNGNGCKMGLGNFRQRICRCPKEYGKKAISHNLLFLLCHDFISFLCFSIKQDTPFPAKNQ